MACYRVVPVMLVLACVSPLVSKSSVTSEEALAFTEHLEAAIRARDWDAVRGAFLPSSKIVYQERGDLAPSRFGPEWWIEWLASSGETFAYSRSREIQAVEPRPDGVLVRSRITESSLATGSRKEVTTLESMHVMRHREALRITVLGLQVEPLRVERLEE